MRRHLPFPAALLRLLLPLLAICGQSAAAAAAIPWPEEMSFSNPLVIMTTRAARVEDMTNSTSINLYVIDTPDGTGRYQLWDSVDHAALNSQNVRLKAKAHTRGRSTAGLPKKQFTVKLEGDWPADHGNGNFLGMEFGGSEWIFNAPGFIDMSMIRDVASFDMQRTLGQDTGSNAWAPRTKYFELFTVFDQPNGTAPTMDQVKNGYAGLYINFENVIADPHRVPIPTHYAPVSSDAVGGLLLQINPAEDNKKQLAAVSVANTGEPMLAQWPESAYFDSHEAQLQAVHNWYYNPGQSGDFKGWAYLFNNVPDGAINPPDTPQPGATGIHSLDQYQYWHLVEKYTNLQSMAEYLLLNEVTKDPDGYHRSTFMYRQPDTLDVDGTTLIPGQMCAGPLWDKNKSYANPSLHYGDFFSSTEGWLFRAQQNTQAPWWWTTLAKYDGFQRAVNQVWRQGTQGSEAAFSYDRMASVINRQKAYISPAYARDYAKYYSGDAATAQARLNQEVDSLLSYLRGRLAWLNGHVQNLAQ